MVTKSTSSTLASAIAALRLELDRAAAEIAGLEGQRESVATAPPAREDVYQAIDGWLSSQVDRYRPALREMLGGVIQDPLRVDTVMQDPGRPWLARPLSLAGQHERLDAPAVAAGALALVAGDAIRAALRAEVDELLKDQPQGLPLDRRRQKLADLDEAIAAKRAALDAMKAEARSSGVTLN